MSDTTTFRESVRDMRGFTVAIERRALLWMAPRLPSWVSSDHLTLLAATAMVLGGVAYATSATMPAALWIVSLLLVVNWFGDSLDGTLARVRQQPRPRYGFYVDHVVDAAGAGALLAGLGWSGLMSPLVACGLAAAYFLVAIETYLATYCVGRFTMSAGGIGGTELRLLLIAINAGAYVMGPRAGLLDPIGLAAIALLVLTFATAAIRHTQQLFREEPLPTRVRRPGTPSRLAAEGHRPARV
ncbi:MAG: hypothetical protein AMXMBFR57_05720 [Acidimicrobiia bacterium]